MSDHLILGASDAAPRWVGVRRHQVVAVLLAIGLVGDWTIRPRSSALEVVLGTLLAGSAVCVRGGVTGAEFAAIVTRYRLRSRWSSVGLQRGATGWELRSDATVEVAGFELEHRGRLDLSGGDVAVMDRLGELLVGLSLRGPTAHVSLHVARLHDRSATLMTLPTDTPPGEGWRDQPGLLRAVVGLDDDEVSRRYLERWSYLRSRRDLLQVLRVRDFGSVSSGHALLEHLQRTSGSITVALHVEVVETSKAQGLAARAVHRLGSDSAATRAAGFRRTAQSARAMDRVVQREELVAGGEAMLRLALYMVVSAASLDQLRVATRELTARAERSGHRVELGHGRQALWFSAALPGGPGW